MLYPATDELLEYTDNGYVLSIVVSKRARQILNGSEPRVKSTSKKAVTIAAEEIAEGLVKFEEGPEEDEK